jgi:Uma2 family endonuclease
LCRERSPKNRCGQLGWLIDPEERVVLVYRRDRLPDELIGDAVLPSLPALDLLLTTEQLFGWLQINHR